MSEQSPNTSGSSAGRSDNAGRALGLARLVSLCLLIAVGAALIAACGSSSGAASSTTAAAKSSSAATARKGSKPNGWGAEKGYLGRYRLLSATQLLSSGAAKLSSGELTMFMREEHKGAPLVPSGILELRGAAPIGIELLYLTSLSHTGNVRHAVVNGGSFSGPVLGSLTAVPGGAGKLSATATVRGLGTLRASFVRFSDSPQP